MVQLILNMTEFRMKKPINQLLIPLLVTFVLVFSCGESDSPTQTVSSSSSTTKEDELSLDEQVVEIDLVAEEAAIRTEHQALVENIWLLQVVST